jgi:hypothetical protein
MGIQTITTEGGEELVVLPRRDYDALIARAGLSPEDRATAGIVAASTAALAAGTEIELPSVVAEAIADGTNPIRAIRDWRGLTQAELARRLGMRQPQLSGLERGYPFGAGMRARLAAALGVPAAAFED